jgi:hypothetical protein
MAIDVTNGQTIKVTINKAINRAGAKKTLERLFMLDKTVSKPLEARSRNFIPLPKRRGGQIWTKRPNKLHPNLIKGASATLKASPQLLRDLNSVEMFVQVQKA